MPIQRRNYLEDVVYVSALSGSVGIYHQECYADSGLSGGLSDLRDREYAGVTLCSACGSIVPVRLSEEALRDAPLYLERNQRDLFARYYGVCIRNCSQCGHGYVGRCACRRAEDLPVYSFSHDCVRKG